MTITLIIVIITSVISLIALRNRNLIEQLIFYPPAVSQQNQWYRFLSCALIHADAFHLIFNMFTFYSFGNFVEASFTNYFGSLGPILYIALYVISQVLCLIPTYVKHKDDYHYRSLGTSGAVSAVIFAGIFIAPLQTLVIFPIPFPIPGFIFGFIYLGITAFLEKRGMLKGINHSAHLFGALAGIGLLIVFGYAFSQYDFVKDFIVQIKSYIA